MRISVFGLGYVGTVSAASLASDGHTVIALDANPGKIAMLAAGVSPVHEPGLGSIVRTAVSGGSLKASDDPVGAVLESELSLVCVGTPGGDGGGPDLQFVERVCRQIGAALRQASHWHTVVLRSTMLPGSTEEVVVPILEAAAERRAGSDFGVCYNPEFLREGMAVDDFRKPTRVLIGELDTASGDVLEKVYGAVDAPIVRTALRTAEMVKYADNAFHALKVAFANEIGSICAAVGIDSHAVMDVFALDTKLNLSAAYLQPGAAFGGSCLPKDLRALIHHAQLLQAEGPLLPAVLASNERQKAIAVDLVRRTGRKKIGVLGLSFKNGSDDLRESPAVEMIEQLLDEGCDVAVYDPDVAPAALIGSNRSYIERELRHFSALMRPTLAEVVAGAEVLVITTKHDQFSAALDMLRPDQKVIDLVRIRRDCTKLGAQYAGISW